MRLSGKVVVTGCAVGLGRAVATRFAQEGAAVVAVDINIQGGYAGMEQIHEDGGCVFAFADIAEETWERTMSVNLHGTFLCAKHVIPFMLKPLGGSIINVGSPTGLIGCAPNLTLTAPAKLAFTDSFASWQPRMLAMGFRVNTMIPGTMDTSMNNYPRLNDKKREQYREAVLVGRLGTPGDIEGLAVFHASEESAYCTGRSYTCDGGLTAV
jgi:NAD(P)-dependent dehydrogenase (short-subunit alcohol dehydrogenase family)